MGTGSYGGKGGGILCFRSSSKPNNNIIWGNTQTTEAHRQIVWRVVTFEFSDIQGGYPGAGEFDLVSAFCRYLFLTLPPASPAWTLQWGDNDFQMV